MGLGTRFQKQFVQVKYSEKQIKLAIWKVEELKSKLEARLVSLRQWKTPRRFKDPQIKD